MKGSEKTIDCLNLARELENKWWKMKLIGILITVGAPGKIPKRLEKRLAEVEI